MALPNVEVKLKNGGLGRVAQLADGVAGLILTGVKETDSEDAPIDGSFDLNKVYTISSVRDIDTLKITEANNPLVYKDVTSFFEKAGDGAELYLLVLAEATTLAQICGTDADSPLHTLINYAKGRIRLVGINRLPADGYLGNTAETGIDKDAVTAGETAQVVATSYADKFNPFRVLLPAILWDGKTDKLYKPRESTFNRVGYVMASDKTIGDNHTAAIGRTLGTAASIPVNYSIARVKNGVATLEGKLTNGKTPEENESVLNLLNDVGYIIYRSFVGRNGYYLNDDPMAAPLTDDYSNLNLGRVIDKLIIICYDTYIDEICDSLAVDDDGKIPASMCVYYESLLENNIGNRMSGELSAFDAYIDPSQNILSTSILDISAEAVPTGILRNIRINLGFSNPALKQ